MSSPALAQSLDALAWDNRFVAALPGDPEPGNFVRKVTRACYSRVLPTPVPQPTLIAYAPEVAELIGLDPQVCETDIFAEVFAGNRILPQSAPFAMCYGGHQFGTWAGQLGDGRAINLGEVNSVPGGRQMLQLKGAGPTPYSRTADGLAVLRSSLREFLCSEAMHHLGIPTTRALSLVATGKGVLRDMFYDGNPRIEPGAVCCRVAPTFLRFGNFQLHASRQEIDLLKQLVHYTINTDFAQSSLLHSGLSFDEQIAAWFNEICRSTARLIVHWTRVGFVHGVMNTDNMSILGLTIDYGPYGWLEEYDPTWTPNTTDAYGRRYCYGQQPAIAGWNLLQLANALTEIVADHHGLQAGLDAYGEEFRSGWRTMLAAKLGLREYRPDLDDDLSEELFSLLSTTRADMTLFFRNLANVTPDLCDESSEISLRWSRIVTALNDPFYGLDSETTVLDGEQQARWCAWFAKYGARIASDPSTAEARIAKMNSTNPQFVLRNYLAQQAIDRAEQGDFTAVHELLNILRQPYAEQPNATDFAQKRPEWARNRAGCSMLSCSS